SRPFLLFPRELSAPVEDGGEPAGAEHVHRVLRRWLRELDGPQVPLTAAAEEEQAASRRCGRRDGCVRDPQRPPAGPHARRRRDPDGEADHALPGPSKRPRRPGRCRSVSAVRDPPPRRTVIRVWGTPTLVSRTVDL
ncbi:hypothetical protein AB0F30_33300, partial [Streptomyces sp. NPDC029006]